MSLHAVTRACMQLHKLAFSYIGLHKPSFFRTVLTGLGFLGGNWERIKEKCKEVNLIEPVVEGVTQLFFQSIILYIIHGPGTSKIHCKYQNLIYENLVLPNKCLARPFDLRSLLTSSSPSPYFNFYFVLLLSTIISVGVSFARLLTQGKSPVIHRILSFKFLKVLLMMVLKFLVQSYFLSMAVKSMMYKFVSKEKSHNDCIQKY